LQQFVVARHVDHPSSCSPTKHSFDPRTTALLLIDLQNDFVETGAPLDTAMAYRNLPRIKYLIAFCREKGIAVIWPICASKLSNSGLRLDPVVRQQVLRVRYRGEAPGSGQSTGAITANTAPRSTVCPAAQYSVLTVPAHSATIRISIFIDDSIATTAPATTTSPAETLSCKMTPIIGALTSPLACDDALM